MYQTTQQQVLAQPPIFNPYIPVTPYHLFNYMGNTTNYPFSSANHNPNSIPIPSTNGTTNTLLTQIPDKKYKQVSANIMFLRRLAYYYRTSSKWTVNPGITKRKTYKCNFCKSVHNTLSTFTDHQKSCSYRDIIIPMPLRRVTRSY